MTTATIDLANQLAELCREGKNLEAIEKFYSKDIVSIEPCGEGDMPARMEGIDNILKKNKWWLDNFTVDELTVYGPYPKDDQFALASCVTITNKATNETQKMEEIALYTVKDNKIVQEEFFYNV